jgi:hypothetical protein
MAIEKWHLVHVVHFICLPTLTLVAWVRQLFPFVGMLHTCLLGLVANGRCLVTRMRLHVVTWFKCNELTISLHATSDHTQQLEKYELHDHHKHDYDDEVFEHTLSNLLCSFGCVLVVVLIIQELGVILLRILSSFISFVSIVGEIVHLILAPAPGPSILDASLTVYLTRLKNDM